MIQIIDVEKIIRSQKNDKVSNLPGFIIKLIKWWVKEKEMNKILRKVSHLRDFDFVDGVIKELDLKIEIEGLENIPNQTNLIFVGNHALGGVDFFALVYALKQKGYTRINHPANKVLSDVQVLNGIIVPINVFGKISNEDRILLEKRLSDNSVPVTIFPSGEVMRKYRGNPDDGMWKSGFVKYAQKYKKDVVPFYIPTENSKIFYLVASLRRKLGIKANIELFWLPRELLKKKGKSVKIIFGNKIPHQRFDKSKTVHEWAYEVKKITYELGGIKIEENNRT